MNRENAFILSSWRAGSTLLQRILNAHSRIVGLHEMHFPFLELPPEARGWWRPECRRDMRLVLEALAACGVGAGWRELLSRDPLRNRATFDRVANAIRATHQKALFLDKTPNYSLHPQLIETLFPEGVPRILLVRSPGGVAASCRATFPDVFPTIEAGLEHWHRYYSTLAEQMETQPRESCYRVAYEELLCGDAAVRKVCEFLHVEFEPTMLEYASKSPASSLTGRRDFGDPSAKLKSGKIDSANGERWIESHGAAVERWLDARPEARELAAKLGYAGALASEVRGVRLSG